MKLGFIVLYLIILIFKAVLHCQSEGQTILLFWIELKLLIHYQKNNCHLFWSSIHLHFLRNNSENPLHACCFSVICPCHCKLVIFDFWTFGQTQPDIRRHHLGLWELVTHTFSQISFSAGIKSKLSSDISQLGALYPISDSSKHSLYTKALA